MNAVYVKRCVSDRVDPFCLYAWGSGDDMNHVRGRRVMTEPVVFQDADKLAEYVIEKAGNEIVFGTQLGLGKPNNIINAIYKRALEDPEIRLRIITGLSLEPPGWSNELERRFLEPLVERIWGGYVPLDYARDARLQTLPDNITVSEFFYKAGAFLKNPHMQQNYISTNYTHAARDILLNGMNVAGALLGQKEVDGTRKFSVGCNGDTAVDAIDLMREKEQKEAGYKGLVLGEINENLPFMYGDAVVDPSEFDAILEGPQSNYTLFGAPKEPVSTTDYMIGVLASCLVPDDGTLQIGIGSLGDSIAYGLVTRHANNALYRKLVEDAGITGRYGDLVAAWGGTGVFEKGLYGCTEMLVDTFIDLYQAGIMKRRVYDDVRIQQLVHDGVIAGDYKITPEALGRLVDGRGIRERLTEEDVDFLTRFGVLKEGVRLDEGELVLGDTRIAADLGVGENRERVAASMLGETLKEGYWSHAGFYLGPPSLYETLNGMSEDERKGINMTSVLNVNQLYANNKYASEELKIMQRKNARFINAGLMVSLNGAVISDGLEDMRVVSGIGGQYNFVAQAHILDDARGAIMIRSTRGSGQKLVSNIVTKYGHCSVPRHLRDMVITEYGIADLRGRSDKEVIKEMIQVADSRFQDSLITHAKSVGKLESGWMLPDRYRNNRPEAIEALLRPYREKGLFPVFPFGTAFTDEEVTIGKALKTFKAKADQSKLAVGKGVLKAFLGEVPAASRIYLERMGLETPANFQEKLLQKVVLTALSEVGAI